MAPSYGVFLGADVVFITFVSPPRVFMNVYICVGTLRFLALESGEKYYHKSHRALSAQAQIQYLRELAHRNEPCALAACGIYQFDPNKPNQLNCENKTHPAGVSATINSIRQELKQNRHYCKHGNLVQNSSLRILPDLPRDICRALAAVLGKRAVKARVFARSVNCNISKTDTAFKTVKLAVHGYCTRLMPCSKITCATRESEQPT